MVNNLVRIIDKLGRIEVGFSIYPSKVISSTDIMHRNTCGICKETIMMHLIFQLIITPGIYNNFYVCGCYQNVS